MPSCKFTHCTPINFVVYTYFPQLEPQLSSQIQELIRMEEKASQSGQHDRESRLTTRVDSLVCDFAETTCCSLPACKAILMRICLQMQKEVQSALKYIIDLHAKQRKQLYRKQEAEKSAFLRKATERFKSIASSNIMYVLWKIFLVY